MNHIQLNLVRNLRNGLLSKVFPPAVYRLQPFSRSYEILKKHKLSQKSRDDEMDFDPDAPLKFRGSGAETYRSHQTFTTPNAKNGPVSQAVIVPGALMVFLAYFCILREENDIDEQLGRPMVDSVPEEHKEEVMKMTIQVAVNEGWETKELEEKLAILQETRIRKEEEERRIEEEKLKEGIDGKRGLVL